ncbi:hypothetical protein ACLOJK_038437 [Asimina triloba]
MDFTKLISKGAVGDSDKPSSHEPQDSSLSSTPSSAQLLSSAKLVADAGQTALRDGADKVDMGRVSGAGADLLGGASHYGKLEEKSFGQYVEKAEDYLHQYHTSHSTTPAAPAGAAAAAAPADHPPSSTDHKPASESGDAAASEGGYGDYLKTAQGFLKKN